MLNAEARNCLQEVASGATGAQGEPSASLRSDVQYPPACRRAPLEAIAMLPYT